MNVAYRRSAITELDRAILLRGFWETTVHPLLAQKGFVLYLSDEIRILHKKKKVTLPWQLHLVGSCVTI